MVDGDARYEPDQSEAEDVRRGVEADASVACGGEQGQTVFEIEYPSHGGFGGADTDKTHLTSHGSQ